MNSPSYLKKLISASRRVDLIAFYPEYMVERIKEIGCENIHTLVIWTKNPKNILLHPKVRKCFEELNQIYILMTVTGLGGTPLEPFAPETKEVFDQLPRIIEFIGSPQRLAIRYDPLMDVVYKRKIHLSNLDVNLFTEILEKAHSLGIKRIIVSYVTLYQKVIERLKRNDFEIVDHKMEEITDFIKNKMMPRVEKLEMELSTCVLPDLTTKGCIDGETLTLLHPKLEPCSKVKDPSQRETCHCTKSYDIGQWFSCYHNCLYCYGNPKLP